MQSRSSLLALYSVAAASSMLLLLGLLPSSSEAFATRKTSSLIQPTPVSTKSMQSSQNYVLLNMSSDDNDKSKISDDGTFYDDEVDTAPIKQGISDSMKAKLMAEASTGLDSEKPQTNVILYISVVVVILVALAGGGILY